jgi:thiol-disulfide isomerase/thioredoxin
MNSPILRGAIAAAIIAVIVAVVLVLQTRRGDGDPSPPPVLYDAAVYNLCSDDVAAKEIVPGGAPVKGEPAPDFALCDADGAFVTTLSGMKGKVVWLNFWATWCVPCKKELPDIQKLYDEKRDEGLEVLIINYQEPQAKALEFLPKIGIALPVVIDRSGEIYEQYKLTGLPDSFFVGRDGTIAALYYGFVTEEIARGRLADAGLP